MIRVNDKYELEWEEAMTVSLLLERLKFSFPLIIVSVDGVMVHKQDYADHVIPDGADVRVIHMTAGG
jgi:thiamine biosynthesis protein ThiS